MDTLPLAIANGWGCGISCYAVVLITGLVGRSGAADTPEVLQRTDVLVAAAVLLAIEFVADKVPYVDSVWDSVHTVVRPAIAAGVGALVAGATVAVFLVRRVRRGWARLRHWLGGDQS